MEETHVLKSISVGEEAQSNDYDQILQSLPKIRNWDGLYLYQYRGYWFPSRAIKGMLNFQQHFKACDNDIILITAPKSGTTWLKALTFATVNRARYTQPPPYSHPLLTTNPHELVRFFEFDLYAKNECPNLEDLPKPRIFATHTPYKLLPRSVIDSGCRIVYLCRNPFDQFISHWHFLVNQLPEIEKKVNLDEALDMFCEGVDGFGPFWDNVLGYWKEKLERPLKVLFMKYEDLKEDTILETKKLADFLGFPFSEEEVREGVVEEISKLCSFDNLKNLEVNKTGKQAWKVQNSAFFRKGEVGDWTNYLTPSMAERMEKLVEEKFSGSGLNFQLSSKVKMDPHVK